MWTPLESLRGTRQCILSRENFVLLMGVEMNNQHRIIQVLLRLMAISPGRWTYS